MTALPVRPEIQALVPWAKELRRRIHQCAEPAYEEVETSAIAREVLAEAGLAVKSGFGKTGLAALWDSGRPGPTIAVRGEMDALMIQEPEGSPFRSKNAGVMHACGHDFNLAMVLALARMLKETSLPERLKGRLMFICQPAEEGGAGAKAMIEDGLFETVARPDLIFATHSEPMLPLGRLVVNHGAIMAGTMDFDITVRGQGGHAAMPESACNPLPAAARLITAISEFKRPADALITVSTAKCGERPNVIAPEARLGGTLRYHYQEARDHIVDFINRDIARVEAADSRIKVKLSWYDGYPPTINHKGPAMMVESLAREYFGASNVGPEEPPSFGGEDFAFFLEKIPGVFFFLGGGGAVPAQPLHSPGFQLNEDLIPPTLEFWARLAEKATNG